MGRSVSGALYPGSGETGDNKAVQVSPSTSATSAGVHDFLTLPAAVSLGHTFPMLVHSDIACDEQQMQGPELEASQAPMNGPAANGHSDSGTAPAMDAAESSDSAGQQIEEDPESEFKGAAQYEAGMPRIINVGIDGPGTADTDHIQCAGPLVGSSCEIPQTHMQDLPVAVTSRA